MSREPSPTNMGDGSKLGGLVPVLDGFWFTFTTPEEGDDPLAGWGTETELTLAVLDTSGNVTEGSVALGA